MTELDELFETLGLKRSSSTSTVLLNGLLVERFVIFFGTNPIGFTYINCSDFDLNNFLEEIFKIAQLERIILHLEKITPELKSILRHKKIGFIDAHGSYYLPLELTSSDTIILNDKKNRLIIREDRTSSMINEFLVGYIFFKNHGVLEKSQMEIGKEINKSAATINFILKNMENERFIAKYTANKYILINPQGFFDKWRMLLNNFQSKFFFGKFSFPVDSHNFSNVNNYYKFKEANSNNALANFSLKYFIELYRSNVSFGGGFIDTAKEGYLQNSNQLNVYIANAKESIFQSPGLVSNKEGEITLYTSPIDLGCENNFVHDSLLCAELINNSNPRLKEAGEIRLKNLMKKIMMNVYEKTN